jgi:hypothetical protein
MGVAMSKEKVQAKFAINEDIYAAFKAKCASEGVVMATAVSEWMRSCQPTKAVKSRNLTRPQRRKTVIEIVRVLNEVLANEEDYRDSIPEQFTQRYEAADELCGKLTDAIGCLEDIE